MIVKIKLQKEDVIALSFHAFFRRKTLKLLVAIYSILLTLTLILLVSSRIPSSSSTSMIIGMSIFILLFLPCLVYIAAIREFESNKRLNEEVICSFDKEKFHIQGESFNTTCTWNKIYKFSETKKYFFVWQSKNSANIIPKRYMKEEDIECLRAIIMQ